MDVDRQDEDQSFLHKETSEQQKTGKTFKFKKFLLLASLALLQFFMIVCSTIPAPFFARVMVNKGGTVFETALSSRIRLLSFVTISALLGRYYSRIGTKRLLWSGIFGSAFTHALFGLMDFVNDHTIFVVGTLLTRLLFGVFKAAITSAAHTIAFQECPNRISLIFGVFLASSGFGYMLGPGLGGILYDHFGMTIPILATALLSLMCGLFPCCLIEVAAEKKDTGNADISLRSVLSKPLVIATLLLTGSAYGTLGYSDVALTLYFQDRGFSTSLAGVGLMISGVTSAGISPIVGYVAGKSKYIRHFSVSIAAILYSCVMFAFTPNQLLSVIYVSCAGLGLFRGMSNTPSFEVLLVTANNGPLDRKSNPALYGAIMGLWQSALGLGLLLSPLIASFIQSETFSSFTWIFYGLSIFHLVLAVVQFILSVIFPQPLDKSLST